MQPGRRAFLIASAGPLAATRFQEVHAFTQAAAECTPNTSDIPNSADTVFYPKSMEQRPAETQMSDVASQGVALSAPATNATQSGASAPSIDAAGSCSTSRRANLGAAGQNENEKRQLVRLTNMGPRFNGEIARVVKEAVLRASPSGAVKTWQVELADGRQTWVMESMWEPCTQDEDQESGAPVEGTKANEALDRAAELVADTMAAVSKLLAGLRGASRPEQKAILSRKRALESADAYL